ncbi:MAG: site-2 protease family protein [archaeon]
MYKAKWGLKLMDKYAKLWPNLSKLFAFIGVIVGFGGMLFVFCFLIIETWKFIITPGAEAALKLIIPTVQIPGLPPLSFWHWIISIFLVAVVHEFSHGVVARLYRVKIRSSGFAFLGPLLAAFVEPDEKGIQQLKKRKQLAIFAAGPFSNIVMAGIFLFLLFYVTTPLQGTMLDVNGIQVNELMENYSLIETGIETPFVLYKMNGLPIYEENNFEDVILFLKDGDVITLGTDKGEYEVTAIQSPDDPNRALVGMKDFRLSYAVKDDVSYLGSLPLAWPWINLLILWIFLISLGVGLFNLLPLGPIDGGRMFYTLLLGITHNELHTRRIWTMVSWFCLLLIVINLLPLLNKLLIFLLQAVTILISLTL